MSRAKIPKDTYPIRLISKDEKDAVAREMNSSPTLPLLPSPRQIAVLSPRQRASTFSIPKSKSDTSISKRLTQPRFDHSPKIERKKAEPHKDQLKRRGSDPIIRVKRFGGLQSLSPVPSRKTINSAATGNYHRQRSHENRTG